jgi:site-specific recombinase XerD
MTTALTPTTGRAIDAAAIAAKQAVLDALSSDHSRRAYDRALSDFLAWYAQSGQTVLNKAAVQGYRAQLEHAGVSGASINQPLSAIRKLARELSDNITDPAARMLLEGVAKVEGVRAEGKRMGNWLTLEQASELVNAPDTKTLKGLRDRAILAVLIGCGLRRAEAVRLAVSHIQQRDGRWVIVDLTGKRNKLRSVAMPVWAKSAIDAYTQRAGIASGLLFRPVTQRDELASGERVTKFGKTTDTDGLSDQAIYNIVAQYASECGFDVAAHDLRRTFAKLARAGGAQLEQISVNLGHGSLQTTQRYLGTELDLHDAPADRIAIKLLHNRVNAHMEIS